MWDGQVRWEKQENYVYQFIKMCNWFITNVINHNTSKIINIALTKRTAKQ